MRAGTRSSQSPGEAAPSTVHEARIAGIRDFTTPTLEAVERRRWQLWLFAGVVMVGLAGGMVLLTFEGSPVGQVGFVPLPAIRVLFVGLAFVIALYLFDKERRLRSLTRLLVDERVLSAALSNRLKELSLLSEVGKAINQLLDLDDVLGVILQSAVDLLEAEEGSIMLLDAAGEQLVTACAVASRDDLVMKATVKLGQGIAGWVAKSREPLLISGPASREGLFEGLEEKERAIVSAVSVPLIGQDTLYGVLNVNSLSGARHFSEYDLRALGLFAEHAAIAIRNASVYEQEKQVVKRLEEVDRMKTEFVATVSHELRTPLTAIIGSAKTMRRRWQTLGEAQRAELIEMVEQQGGRLLRMVEEILSASKIEFGSPTLRREEVELVAIARRVVSGYEAVGVPNPIELDAPERTIAYGDGTALEQILVNLVDNAIKYSDPGSPVKVTVAEEPGAVLIRVSDRGKGIPSSAIPTIFERFRQVDQSTTRQAGGVGLGLYIVKGLVEAGGGKIEVASEEGKGSTFTVALPKRS